MNSKCCVLYVHYKTMKFEQISVLTVALSYQGVC